MEVVLIDHYDSFSFNVLDWLRSAVPEIYGVRYVAYDDAAAMQSLLTANNPLVLSPGPGRPESAEPTLRLVREKLAKVPILGICLGHQVLGQLAGARTIPAKAPFHGTTRLIQPCTDTGLFQGLGKEFRAASYNSLIVEPVPFTSPWRVTAYCEQGEIQGLAYEPERGAPAWGVQFHPESFLSEQAAGLRENWWNLVQAYLQQTIKR